MCQYMVGPEFLTQAIPERLGERIKEAATEIFPMDQGEEQVEPVLYDAPRRLQMMVLDRMIQRTMGNSGKKTAGWPEGAVEMDAPTHFNNSMHPEQIDTAKWTRRNVELREGVVTARPAERTSSRDTAQDAGDAQKIAKGRKSTIGSDQGHRVEREVKGHLQETQRKTGKLQIGWIVKSKAVE
ncbi:hypothetical protein GGX14DRAFT_658371 [Mycena pura]|uniref:Uncharacterized protein n=1 Tax=Mycena pura TaxID=153505 RepID=A0AAD6YMA3_9AGAR|nr:hypothetical protein GGX14DRAFT_658371 [Mycena pura]